MANTYTQLYYHIVFAVKYRRNLIDQLWKEELQKYITGVIIGKNQTLININGMPDHLHILAGMKPDLALSDFVRDIKANSSRFINERRFVRGRFEWQLGFGAFSVGYRELDIVCGYIDNQELHHYKKSFREEYLELLNDHRVDYNVNYIFNDRV